MSASHPSAPAAGEGPGLDAVQALSSLLPDGLVTVNAERLVRYVNPRAAQILQLDVEWLVGRPLVDALPFTDVDGRSWWTLANPWEGLHTRTGFREKLLWTPEGVEVLVTGKYLRPHRGGPVTRMVLSLRDAQARQRAEQDHAALLSTLAHELRSPLTSVKGFSSTMLRRWDRFGDEQKRLMIETIEADADRIARLVADLLDVSRIDAGRLQVRRQHIHIGETVERHRRRLSTLGLDEERVLLDVRRPLPATWADPDRLDQIVINLLDNAVKHGGGRITVTVRPGTVDLADGADGDPRPAVLISVADEGAGIPRRLRSVIFGRFWHQPGQGNTGLGLYVVKALVEAHGGRIVAGNVPTGGALFTFSLPAGEPDEPGRVAP